MDNKTDKTNAYNNNEQSYQEQINELKKKYLDYSLEIDLMQFKKEPIDVIEARIKYKKERDEAASQKHAKIKEGGEKFLASVNEVCNDIFERLKKRKECKIRIDALKIKYQDHLEIIENLQLKGESAEIIESQIKYLMEKSSLEELGIQNSETSGEEIPVREINNKIEKTINGTAINQTISVPNGTKWEEIILEIEDKNLVIRIGDKEHKLHFQDAGFADKRKRNNPEPNQKWRLLRYFAENNGKISFGKFPKDISNPSEGPKKPISDLRKHLQKLFGFDDDPFIPVIKYKQCQARFKIYMKITSFPASIISWEHLYVALKENGSLVMSAVTEENTIIRENESNGPGFGVQERDFNQIYDLRTIRLAGDNAKPNKIGETLIELIKSGGRIGRPYEDINIRDLDKFLRNFFNRTDSALYYEPPNWIANFKTNQ